MTQKIAIQGIAGAFHETAARQYFGDNIELTECLTFKALCDALKQGEVLHAVMAIENTIAGSILPNYSLLREYGFKIIGETFLHIQMNLMALPGIKLSEIKTVMSHPMAIRQCAEFLNSLKDLDVIEHKDTAGAAKQIREEQLKDVAAIANIGAAELYELEVLEKRIETNKLNFTRFLILSKENITTQKSNKASLVLQLGHEVGALADVLNTFKTQAVNLTKIQSMPILGKPYEYHFHIDVEWESYLSYETAIDQILKQASGISILGEYEKSEFELNKN